MRQPRDKIPSWISGIIRNASLVPARAMPSAVARFLTNQFDIKVLLGVKPAAHVPTATKILRKIIKCQKTLLWLHPIAPIAIRIADEVKSFRGPNLSSRAPLMGEAKPYTADPTENIKAVLARLHPYSLRIAT